MSGPWCWGEISVGRSEDILIPHFNKAENAGIFMTTENTEEIPNGFVLHCLYEDEVAHHGLLKVSETAWTINGDPIQTELSSVEDVIRYLTELHFEDVYPWMTPLTHYVPNGEAATIVKLFSNDSEPNKEPGLNVNNPSKSVAVDTEAVTIATDSEPAVNCHISEKDSKQSFKAPQLAGEKILETEQSNAQENLISDSPKALTTDETMDSLPSKVTLSEKEIARGVGLSLWDEHEKLMVTEYTKCGSKSEADHDALWTKLEQALIEMS
eukprot:m.339287 g.339287  ORF g.339287 m.339287 type:complete len:268 (-) comp18736_c0_seq1:2069-2872(-)